MRKARIIKPVKNPMQSGRANVQKWRLTFQPENARFLDPLMGWTGSTDMSQEVVLYFNTQEEAIDYARRQGLEYDVVEAHKRKVEPKSYASNFSFHRVKAYSLPKRQGA